MTAVGDPGLAAKEEGGDAVGLIESNLGVKVQILVLKDLPVDLPKATDACLMRIWIS